jgi:hypothetical protein
VVAWNLHRRQLTISQRAEVARMLKPMYEEQARERMAAGGGDRKSGVANLPDPIPDQARARDQAAAAVGVSGRTVQDAEYVHTHAPELSEEIKAGRMTVNAATKEVKQRESAPKRPTFKTPEQEEKWYAKEKEKEGKGKMIPSMLASAIHRLRTEIDLCAAKGWARCDKDEVRGEIRKLERMIK